MDARYDRLDSAVITAQSVSFSYENSRAVSLEIGDLQIPAGQFVVVCGPSGSGKSTFLKLLNGLIPDYFAGQLEGRLTVGDLQAGASRVEELAGQVASVFQNPASQFFHKLVKEELVFPAENQGRPVENILSQLQQLVTDFALTDYLDREMNSLSGGEKQRMALLTAIMQDSPILVLDEPTANLDRAGVQQVREHLQALKVAGKTILLAEHRLDYVGDLADRYLYFDQGRLVADWSAERFLDMTEAERHQLSLRSLRLPDLTCLAGQALSTKGLTVKNLVLKAGQQDLGVLEEVAFARGSVTAVVGKNGVGKSTLAHYLVGLLEDKSAQFILDGQDLTAKHRLQKTALVLQEVRLQLFTESVTKELTLGLKRAVDTELVCQKLGLQGLEHRHPMTLSGGEQQRLVIASQLLSYKDIFIFDEPTSGLDYQQMQAVAQVLQELKAQQKVVILISHDEELLALVADEVVHLPQNYHKL